MPVRHVLRQWGDRWAVARPSVAVRHHDHELRIGRSGDDGQRVEDWDTIQRRTAASARVAASAGRLGRWQISKPVDQICRATRKVRPEDAQLAAGNHLVARRLIDEYGVAVGHCDRQGIDVLHVVCRPFMATIAVVSLLGDVPGAV